MHSFFEQETGLTVGNGELCVCGACDLSIRQALKAWDEGEPFGIASVSSPVDRLLCSKHYQQVYRMLHIRSMCMLGLGDTSIVPHLTYTFVTCPNTERVESYLKSTIDLVTLYKMVIRCARCLCLASACCPVRILF